MQSLGLTPVAAALGSGDLRFQVAVRAPGFQHLTVAGGRGPVQTQIDAHGGLGGHRDLDLNHHRQVEPPVSYGVLAEAAVPPLLDAEEALGFEHPQGLATESQRPAFSTQARGLEGNPAERLSTPATDPPAQLGLPELPPPSRKLGVDLLDGIGADVLEVLRSTG